MTFVKSNAYPSRKRGFSLPDMAPFAGLLFLLVGFYALTTQFKAPRLGNVALEELPRCENSACLPENAEAVIGLDTAGHYSFSLSGPAFQAVTIQKVAAAYGIAFSNSQRSNLNRLDYLDVDMRELPAILDATAYQQLFRSKKTRQPLSENQLAACVTTAKRVIQSLAHKSTYVSLLIHADTKASSVMHLIAILQNQGINRFNLKLQYAPRHPTTHQH
ncbi:MAG: biopolymer transporter ExbD [Bacteroidota bacterium]|nr:biopolymer transporter ExbD [Bacteroidota bacterium]